MEPNEIFIVGAGTYGEAMYELAAILNYEVVAYFDEDQNKEDTFVMDKIVIGKFSEYPIEEIQGKNFIVAIGNNEIRFRLMEYIQQNGGITPTLIHPSAIVSPSAIIGNGVYIQANANIWTKVKIENYCIISPGVVIAHHTTIGKACLISTLTGVGASINIKEKVFIGMGSTIVTGTSEIGENTIIGAGTVVLKSVESDSVYVGTPARKIKSLIESI
jgi:UDP-perosamine 4-acetyltransferase